MDARFFLAQDGDGHWFIVDAAKRVEWDAWTHLDDEDPRAWEPPDFAERVLGCAHNVEFSRPVDTLKT